MIKVINPKNWIIFTNRYNTLKKYCKKHVLYRIRKNIQSKVNCGLVMNEREKRIFVCSARTERVRLNIMFFKGFMWEIQLWKYQSRVNSTVVDCEIMWFCDIYK